jgi:hypothetical protein
MSTIAVKEFVQLTHEKAFVQELNNLKNKSEALLNKLDTVDFIVFDNKNPYEASTKNLIFFTYSNSYKYNSPIWMQVGELIHPHSSFEDRGYIKGVAVDLYGYSILWEILQLNHSLNLNLYLPKLKNTIHKEKYQQQILTRKKEVEDMLEKEVENIKNKFNRILREKTGCSLLYYIDRIN